LCQHSDRRGNCRPPAALDVHKAHTGGETYRDLDGDYFAYREPERQTDD
jgi:hypothetical protein